MASVEGEAQGIHAGAQGQGMTEDEAKTKWCPFRPVERIADQCAPWESPYPSAKYNESERCIGSGCMAWRWHSFEHRLREYEDGEKEFTSSHDETFGGFCGLAGKA